MSQAVRLPLPPKNETVSHPVKAWNIGNAVHRSGPSTLAISWAAKKRKLFPVPKAIQISVLPWRCAAATAKTTTSVSTVRMDILLNPSVTVSSKCKMILVSASSCVHGVSFETFFDWVQTKSDWIVLRTCFSVSMHGSLFARKLNSSTLFSSVRKALASFLELVLKPLRVFELPFLSYLSFQLSNCQGGTHPKRCFMQPGRYVWKKNLRSIIRESFCWTWSKHVYNDRAIEDDNFHSWMRGILAGINQFFQTNNKVRLTVPVLSLPFCDDAGGYALLSCSKNTMIKLN